MASPIPTFYRFCFTTLDPILGTLGVIGNLFMPSSILSTISTSPPSPIPTSTIALLDAGAGWFLFGIYLQLFLLRRAEPNNLTVWRHIQFGILVVDVFTGAGLMRALWSAGRLEGKWSLANWRSEDWVNAVSYPGLILLRSAFLLGIGIGKAKTN